MLALRQFAKGVVPTIGSRTAAPTISVAGQHVRNLNVHEHQSIELMREHGVGVPGGAVAKTPEEAREIFNSEVAGGAKADVVMKAQILAGGRGLGTFKNGFQGGVHVVTNEDEAHDFASKMLGETLVTKQTGPEGKVVNKVFLMERVYMRREMYFSILLDRATNGPMLVGSPKGGTSIEEVAEATPEFIFTEPINVEEGITPEIASRMAANLQFDGDQAEQAAKVFTQLYEMFKETDATMVEVNPLAETADGRVLVCDAKLNFDDNASFRQGDLFAMRDRTQEDQREVEASQYDLNYIGLDGSIGCLVNGAGLAMATMDIIKLHGGSPANFLDVGGGATAAQVQKAFELLNADNKVKAILVNIFGGIMRCDVIATGIVSAAEAIGLKKPVVVRLQGTNVEQAKMIIETSGFRTIVADDLDDAATKAVRIADIVKQAEEIQVGVSFELPL
jgi:succinyl-CoA synthetase beta subunit